MDIEKLEIIVRENNDMPFGFSSTVGVKCYINGKPEGIFMGFNKPELPVADVVDTANSLIEELLRRVNDGNG